MKEVNNCLLQLNFKLERDSVLVLYLNLFQFFGGGNV